MASLGVGMIVKNEAHNLPRLFESLKDVADEICITDTGSTDGTQEIVKKYGANLSHFDWCDDFAAARNFNLNLIKSDFYLWIDGDDILLNPERIKLFKNDVMNLADYWVAPYHYASDANGNPTCIFVRERIVRRSMGFKWQYFIHEGMPGLPGMRAQITHAVVVKHMRTEEDIKKDHSRNLNIFRKNELTSPLNARMRYYYGKELFEANQPKEAIQKFESAMVDPSLELHDRILCMQYACYAYIQTGMFQKAIEIGQQGTLLTPNRAEFHNIIGDAFLKLGKIGDAKPFFGAAKYCEIQPMHGVNAALFSHEASYNEYPSNQIARIYANSGRFEEAEKELEGTLIKRPNPESKAILDEIRRVKMLQGDTSMAEPCEDIVFTTMPVVAYEFDPGKMKERMMGGSETALIEMAQELHKASKRPVKVFSMRSKAETFDGVEYIPVQELAGYFARHKPHFHIAWRHATKLTDAPTFVWSHDLMTPGVEQINNYTKVLCLTPFHARYMSATQGVPMEKIYITRNGIKPSDFPPFTHEEKDPNQFVFSSSPDRGLDRAMLVLDRVREKHPDIRLSVFYGIEHLPKWGHQELHDKLKRMFAERPWVIYHGATKKEDLYNAFRKAAYCIQPSDFIETSKITAREMLYCGVYQITRKVGGLVDTMAEPEVQNLCTLVDSDCITPEQYQVYIDATLKAVDEKAYLRIKDLNPSDWSWESVAKSWLEELPKLG